MCILGGGKTVKKIVINRLFQSFAELDRAIAQAKETLRSKKSVSQEILDRVDMYEEILEKQKSLATTLCGHASLGNWDEVARHVKLINGLSFMIRDDAREIISCAEQPEPRAQHGMSLC